MPFLSVTLLGIAAALGAAAEPKQPVQSQPAAPQPPWRARVAAELATMPRPAPPPAGGNPIDAFLADWWSTHKLTKPPRMADRAFLRRASLDLVGLLPDAPQAQAFASDTAADKRAQLVDRLLADNGAYAEHWMTFWNDLLRNDEQNYILVTRQPITRWLYQALSTNKPYDEFAGELISPPDQQSAGFVKGVLWEFSSSVSDTPPMQAAQSTAQVFQGVNLKCASCHDHFSKSWKLLDSWSLASFFTSERLQLYRCDKPTGQQAAPKFLFAGLGELPQGAEGKAKLDSLARMVTRPTNPRFAKVIVNRLFKRLLGQGLLPEVDDLDDQKSFHPALLDWLADDLMRHDYDVKHLLRLIATSEVYQLESLAPAVDASEPFAGPRRRRLTCEQFQDAVATVTGYWPKVETMNVPIAGERIRAWRYRQPSRLTTMLGRPTRDVVCSERSEHTSVLTALELVNGQGFRDLIVAGTSKVIAQPIGNSSNPREIADYVTWRAYCRRAADAEVELARDVFAGQKLDAAARQAAWEDYLWIMLDTPEFAYID